MNINLKFELTPNEASYLFAALNDAIEKCESIRSVQECHESLYYQFLVRLQHMLNYT